MVGLSDYADYAVELDSILHTDHAWHGVRSEQPSDQGTDYRRNVLQIGKHAFGIPWLTIRG